MTENAISIKNLTKYYGAYKGIENISLEVRKGTIHGFLGPNGAGKTTTLRTLVGLLQKTSGEAFIFDDVAGSLASKKRIGYLPSDFELYPYYSVKEYLDYIESLRGEAPFKEELIRRLNLDLTRQTGELSKGNKQKVAIVQALMHRPDILIADEPTTGLDPLMQEEFDRILKEYVDSGDKTVFISSHILSEVQRVCEVVTIIREGEIVSSGNVKKLLASLPRKAVLKVPEGTDGVYLAESLGVTFKSQSDDELTVFFEDPKQFMSAIASSQQVLDFTIPPADLEEYFMTYYK
ncbi:MAG: ABC transporter ATP-binding protein [Candidatus Heimdallarchaeota archaeon]|nr:ABC transporter ATP-binding protein [Candidatus Heimdallarchaeota archaeon]